jgi:hypothetical protein
MDTTPPKHPAEHPNRGSDCQFAMEGIFQEAIASAMIAGWSEAEAAEAMLELARNHTAGLLGDADTDTDVEAAASSVM